MAVHSMHKSVTYKNHEITVEKVGDKYKFAIVPQITIRLTGEAASLNDAFEAARKMIDRLQE